VKQGVEYKFLVISSVHLTRVEQSEQGDVLISIFPPPERRRGFRVLFRKAKLVRSDAGQENLEQLKKSRKTRIFGLEGEKSPLRLTKCFFRSAGKNLGNRRPNGGHGPKIGPPGPSGTDVPSAIDKPHTGGNP